jgi:hypothetical protein
MKIVSSLQKSTQFDEDDPVLRDQVVQTFGQSVRGAFGPLNAALKELDSLNKVCELSDAHRFERLRKELKTIRKGLRQAYIEAAKLPDWAGYFVQFDSKTN